MALVGVNGLVIVETEDALLVTTLDQSQDVGKVVKHLDEKKLKKIGCELGGSRLATWSLVASLGLANSQIAPLLK